MQAVFQADWDRCAKTSLTLEFEVGRSLVGRWGVYVRPCVGIFERDLIGATTGMARASCVICSGVSTRGRLGNKPWRKSRHRWMEWTGPEGLVLSVVWGEVQ